MIVTILIQGVVAYFSGWCWAGLQAEVIAPALAAIIGAGYVLVDIWVIVIAVRTKAVCANPVVVSINVILAGGRAHVVCAGIR